MPIRHVVRHVISSTQNPRRAVRLGEGRAHGWLYQEHCALYEELLRWRRFALPEHPDSWSRFVLLAARAYLIMQEDY